MKKFIVDRIMWYRGESSAASRLLRTDGRMCCVGFFAKQILNAKDKDILNESYLCKIDNNLNNELARLTVYNINDSRDLSNKKREQKLESAFNKLGYTVEFIN